MTPHTPDQPSSTIRTNTTAKADSDEINVVLRDCIEGTANGEPDRVRNAFHEDLKRYSIKGDSLEVWEGKGCVDKIEAGEKNARQGRILFVDYEKDGARGGRAVTRWRTSASTPPQSTRRCIWSLTAAELPEHGTPTTLRAK